MSKIYKVWIEVEEIDEAEDHYETLGTPLGGEEFDTEADAWAHAGAISCNGNCLKLIEAVEAILNSEDNAGCSDDLTVVSFSAIEEARDAIKKLTA